MAHEAVLIVGGGLLQTFMIHEAKTMGLYTIVTDGNPDAPGLHLAETDESYVIDTYDAQAHAQLADSLVGRSAHTLRGVATCGADVAPTVALAARHAGTPGIPYATARRTHDKYATRAWLSHSGSVFRQYQPNWTVYGERVVSWEHATWDLDTSEIVVKPRQQRGSRGVSIVSCIEDWGSACTRARRYGSATLFEARLYGTEHSAEIIFDPQQLISGKTPEIFRNIVDRVFTYKRGYAIELGHVNPTILPDDMQCRIYEMLRQVATALGVHWGPFKADVIVTDDGPKLLECTARLSGGFDCQRTTPLATGRNPIRTVLELACNLPLTWNATQPQWQRYAACAAGFPPPGRVLHTPTSIPPGCQEMYVTVKEGDVIEPYQHCGQRPLFVLATGTTATQAWERADTGAAFVAQQLFTTAENADGDDETRRDATRRDET